MRDYIVRHVWLSFTVSKVLGASLLAVLSFSLAKDKQYEASMGAAGVAVAVATMSFDAKQDSEDEGENYHLKRVHELEIQNIQLYEQIRAKDKIHKLEIELAVLKNKNTSQVLTENNETNSDSESTTSPPAIMPGEGAIINTDFSVKPVVQSPFEIKQED